MQELFTRSQLNPILKPNPENDWESFKLYNPGCIFADGKYHLFYRAVGRGPDWKSSIGYAVSADGENFERRNEPLLEADSPQEARGLEDPRITKLDSIYYMCYAAYDGRTPRLSIATSRDLLNWKKHGPVFKDWNFSKAGGVHVNFINGKPAAKAIDAEWSKSGAIFPEKINGKYLMLFGEYRIWFAESEDGLKWKGDDAPFLKPRSGEYFDNTFVEMGPPPIKTENGWLVLYHGIDRQNCYRLGFLLLDLENPRKIIYRSEKPIFEPKEFYELKGYVDVMEGGLDAMQKMPPDQLNALVANAFEKGLMPKVIFCNGAILSDKTLRIYYGAGDSVICTATADLADILSLV